MYEAQSTVTYCFAIDCDHDISGDRVEFSLDKATWSDGVPVGSPSAFLLAAKPTPPKGMTRYWWSILLGPTQSVKPQEGTSRIFGRLTDSPNVPILDWRITLRN